MTWIAALMLAWVAVGLAGPAAAQQSEVPLACRDDVTTLCAGVRAGGGLVMECLKANADRLSARCSAMVAGEPPVPERDYRACQGEVRLFCAGVEPGDGRLRECLRQHAFELSAACRVYQGRIKD